METSAGDADVCTVRSENGHCDATGLTACEFNFPDVDAPEDDVSELKRKLSMLTTGIRLLHAQIEQKSLALQVSGTGTVEPAVSASPVSSDIQAAPVSKPARLHSTGQTHQGVVRARRGGAANKGGAPPRIVPAPAQRSSMPPFKCGRSSFGSVTKDPGSSPVHPLAYKGNSTCPAGSRPTSVRRHRVTPPAASNVMGVAVPSTPSASTTPSIGGARTPRSMAVDTAPSDKGAVRSASSTARPARSASPVDTRGQEVEAAGGMAAPSHAVSCASGSTSARKHAFAERSTQHTRASADVANGSPAGSGAHGVGRKLVDKREKQTESSGGGEAIGSPRATPPAGCGGGVPRPSPKRARSWTPPSKSAHAATMKNTPAGVGSEHLLPPHWRKICAAAYCEATSRQIVDRIRLVECSSVCGRRADVFWLHALVRWADLRLTAEEGVRVPERGEDLTVFVVQCLGRKVAVSSSSRERGQSPSMTDLSPARTWIVDSVRVMKPMSQEHKESEAHFVAMGTLGGTLLRYALACDAYEGDIGDGSAENCQAPTDLPPSQQLHPGPELDTALEVTFAAESVGSGAGEISPRPSAASTRAEVSDERSVSPRRHNGAPEKSLSGATLTQLSPRTSTSTVHVVSESSSAAPPSTAAAFAAAAIQSATAAAAASVFALAKK